jgi:CheY-like chemotaxis protein
MVQSNENMRQPTTAKKILVVDDNEVNRYTLAKMIQARGAEVVQASCGKEAIEVMDAAPDVALVDIHLPDMTGYELLELLRKTPPGANLPLVLMSATEPAPHARSAAASLGVHSFLTLPVVPDDLWIVIEATLHRQKRQA